MYCISAFGIINLPRIGPLKPSDAKKLERISATSAYRKRLTPKKTSPGHLKRANTYHIIRFVEVLMDVLDRCNKKEIFIAIDNCKIHHYFYC